MDLPIVLGKTISNETFVTDLTKMPHLLDGRRDRSGQIGGPERDPRFACSTRSTRARSSSCWWIRRRSSSRSSTRSSGTSWRSCPAIEEAIITDTKKVVATLNSLCIEMDERYELLKEAAVRNIKEYNAKFIQPRLNPEKGHRYLPYIVLVVDEFADLIMTAGREIETPIARLAQLARAIGIHLIIATQRPSVNIITGTIKANFPARIAFRVTSKVDSRTILDTGGADQLDRPRRHAAEHRQRPDPHPVRLRGHARGGAHHRVHRQPARLSRSLAPARSADRGRRRRRDMDDGERDSMFEEAARLVVQTQQGSTSLIQRKLKLGYNRAGRIVDQLEAAGILGPFEGIKGAPRDDPERGGADGAPGASSGAPACGGAGDGGILNDINPFQNVPRRIESR